jgi:hypothetical protein
LLWFYGSNLVNEGDFDVFAYHVTLPVKVIWSVLGELYKAKHDSVNALEAFKKALEMESDNSWLQNAVLELEMSSETEKHPETFDERMYNLLDSTLLTSVDN